MDSTNVDNIRFAEVLRKAAILCDPANRESIICSASEKYDGGWVGVTPEMWNFYMAGFYNALRKLGLMEEN